MEAAVLTEQASPYNITKANAKALSALGNAAKRAKRETLAREEAERGLYGVLAMRARVIDARIQQTLKAFEAANDAQDMQRLAMALDRLYNTWFNLTGHERPGVRKSVSRRQPSSMEPTAPIPPIEPLAPQ